MNTKVIIAFNRVEKDTPDFFKFRSIKKYFNANRISYYDIFNIVKLYDHANHDYAPVEDLVFEANINNANYFVTDASLNKKIISAIRLFLKNQSIDEVKVVKSSSTDEIFAKAIEYIKSRPENMDFPTEVKLSDNSTFEEFASALMSTKVIAEGKYKDLF